MKKVYSFYDKKGMLHVDCAECTRGGNGTDEDSCSAGFRYKKPGVAGCFIGTAKPDVDPNQAERLK